MDGRDCDRVIDAGTWVLGALPDDEAAGYAMHLRGCDSCRSEVARLQGVADVLPMAADQVEPPAALRARVLDAVREEAGRAPALGSRAPARRRRWSPRRVAAIAAVSVAAGAVAATALRQNGPGAPPSRTFALVGARGTLVVEGSHARLHLVGMPAPPEGRVYQVWKQRRGADPQPTDALFTVRRDGSASVDVPGGVQGVARVLVTAEPAGGSDVPSSPPLLTASPA